MNQPENNATPAGATPDLAANSRQMTLADRVKSLRLAERGSAAPRRRFAWIPWVLCVVLAGSSVYFATREPVPASDQAAASKPDGKGPAAPQAQAQAKVAASEKFALEAKGNIIPLHQIMVSPKVSGMIMELFVEEGTRVKEGDVLAKLETTEYQAEYDRVAAMVKSAEHRLKELTQYRNDEVEQARAELEDLKAQRDQLFLDYRRSQELRNSQALSLREFEQSYSAYKSMDFRVRKHELALKFMADEGPRDARIAAGQEEIKQAKAELVRAKWKLDNCVVVAPVSGTILSKKAEKGNIVNPSSFGSTGSLAASICDLADLSDMEVDLAVAERDIARVFKGQKCKIRAEGFPERIYDGQVSRLMPTADRANAAIRVRVKIQIPREEEGQYLRPEMGTIVTFLNK